MDTVYYEIAKDTPPIVANILKIVAAIYTTNFIEKKNDWR